ncbi:serine/threonine protein kinase [Floridanema aerugineum]|jgi:serine/threonine protein kinase|uniref:non-specific serine/threonine protein kinase n=1 Tax=Floridaenema aerugineum BLCC-F46 TaxID=3153654 RepID=A0ABV4X383_9CYAN
MELLHQPEEIIAQRYRIVNILGQGGMGITYEAQDLQTQGRVAIKALSLNRVGDWKAVELFEREAHVLSNLNHPCLPKYLDYFQVETPNNHSFYLVQELVEGRSLYSLVHSGWHATENEVRQLASQILDILNYLHQLTPPIIHRDLKPQNIIRSKDGGIFLVDFGAVKTTYQTTFSGGSTVVGTYGYMAPEQFRGQGYPATDLYGLGATLLFLMTHKSPSEFPTRQLKINFRSQTTISTELADWLEKLLEPAVEDRFVSAKEALSVLLGQGVLVRKRHRPIGSRITFSKNERKLVAEIPRLGWGYWDFHNFIIALISLITSIVLFSFHQFTSISLFFWIFPLFSIIILMFGLNKLKDSIFKLLGRTQLEIDRKTFKVKWSFLGVFYQIQGKTKYIERVELNRFVRPEDELVAKWKNEVPQITTACALIEGVRIHRFGSGLTALEKEWLLQEVASFLRKPLPQSNLPR